MSLPIKNLVFEGGGILGIAYLGVLDYLDEVSILPQIDKVAGTSAGAIAACLACFNTSFNEIKQMISTLDYKKIAYNEPLALRGVSTDFKNDFEKMFGDINAIYRLLNNYGWYSTKYFYDWIKKVIASQFDQTKKKAPYTFEDFYNSDLHRNNKEFKDLYIIGTDLSFKTSVVFSFETTPQMEVAEAIKISMSIPLFFEAVQIDEQYRDKRVNSIYVDGGIMRNYPINLFDNNGINYQTLGVQFRNKIKYSETKNLINYIENLFNSLLKVQEDAFDKNYIDQKRTITINTGGISALDFNISDKDYKFLYDQGYSAAEDYFERSSVS